MIGGRYAAAPTRRRDDDAMLPLINVVLLLLVFFLVAGTLRPPQSLPVTPPTADGLAPEQTGLVRVALAADGTVSLDGAVLDREALLRAMAPGGAVALSADATADAAEALALARALREAGADRVSLVVLAP